jgi:hypothetical protein
MNMRKFTIAALAALSTAPAMANETDDIVRSMAAPDVPAFTDILKAEESKGSITDFSVNPASLTIYVNARGSVERARAMGHDLCEAMSRSQFDRSHFLVWTVDVMAWRGIRGNPSSGYDPVLKCKLGGETVKEEQR